MVGQRKSAASKSLAPSRMELALATTTTTAAAAATTASVTVRLTGAFVQFLLVLRLLVS